MELINEAKRFQKLAGLLTEGEIEEMNNMFEDETLEEEEMDEMARTAGTGGSYTITPEGEAALKQAKATNQLPEGLKGSQLGILIFLFKAKKEGKRVQKIDYAAEKGVPQPAVNALFNELEVKGLATKEGYTSAQKEPSEAKPKADLAAVLADLDLD